MSSTKRIVYSQQLSSEMFQPGEGHRFKFQKKFYATATLIILMFRFTFLGELMTLVEGRVNFIHFFITSAVLFLPVLYVSLFIGHYSKLGCFVISRIIPVANGVGFTMLMVSVLELVFETVFASDTLEFLHLSFYNRKWLSCNSDWGSDCIGLEEVASCASTNCFQNLSQLSVYKYRWYAIRQYNMVSNETDEKFWRNLQGSRVPYLMVTVIIMMVISDLDISSNNELSYLVVTAYLVIMSILALAAAYDIPNISDIFKHLKIEADSLIDLKCWNYIIFYFIENINLSDVTPILIGSYLPPLTMTDLQAFVSWMGLMTLFTLCEITACIVRVFLALKLGTDMTTLMKAMQGDRHNMISVIYPQALGFSSFAPGFLTCLYFTLVFVNCLVRIRLLMACIYNTMADSRPVIRLYRFYIRVFSCCFLFFLAFPMFIVGIFFQFVALLRYLEVCLSTIVIVMLTIGVLYIYGVQTICDDHHFTYGSQPAAFFKVTLLVAPAVFLTAGVFLFLTMSSLYLSDPTVSMYFYIAFPLSILPQIIGLLYITSYYLKRQDMSHLLRCEENWGDPSSVTRKERIIYHPRKETNYFRRIDFCKHECLRYNGFLPYVVKDEEQKQKESFRRLSKVDKIFEDADVGMVGVQ